MWKPLQSGEKVTLGHTVRFQPPNINSSYKGQVYQVVKTEQHYFEIIVKNDEPNNRDTTERRIIKYIDIGYHMRIEVWNEASQTAATLSAEEGQSKLFIDHSNY